MFVVFEQSNTNNYNLFSWEMNKVENERKLNS